MLIEPGEEDHDPHQYDQQQPFPHTSGFYSIGKKNQVKCENPAQLFQFLIMVGGQIVLLCRRADIH
jgi:hypothetical protein